MARNDQQHKTQRGGPEAHPSNEAPSKRGRGARAGGNAVRGGNKVSQGRSADTGNKGKAR